MACFGNNLPVSHHFAPPAVGGSVHRPESLLDVDNYPLWFLFLQSIFPSRGRAECCSSGGAPASARVISGSAHEDRNTRTSVLSANRSLVLFAEFVFFFQPNSHYMSGTPADLRLHSRSQTMYRV